MSHIENMKEIDELFQQIESTLNRMKHMINAQSRCPKCGEPADGLCAYCKEKK